MAGSEKIVDLALFSLDVAGSALTLVERYAWRWAIEPCHATGKQVIGVGDAATRTVRSVERCLPFAFLVQSLMIVWFSLGGSPTASVARRRLLSPWYRTKATPAPADIKSALRDEMIATRIKATVAGRCDPQNSTAAA